MTTKTVRPEHAHHGVAVQSAHARYTVRFLDPSGHVQHLSVTTTWLDNDPLLERLCRGIEQSGCKVLEAASWADQTFELAGRSLKYG